MNQVIAKAQLATDQLSDKDEDYLFTELGKRLSAMTRSPAGSDNFDMTVGMPTEAYGAGDELKKWGRKFFSIWNTTAYGLVCGSAADDAVARNQVQEAFKMGPETVAATIAALLVTHFGLAAALAAVIGSLTVRLFFKPAYKAMCECWKEKLPAPAPAPAA